ncbi:MAG TPA: sugar transferase [Acidimicrobiia bacterium]|nr:sugar transferase [Acidimicrobiia bacterium]
MRRPRLRLAAKRSFDVSFGVFALVFLSPIFLAIAMALWLFEGRPVIYRQTRVGRGGHAFTMYKFRSMVTDAHERLDEVRGENQRAGPLFKAQSDPRCTPVGRFLRLTSLDELPQLFNVISGSMSLVGPRPALFEERESFPAELLEREALRPGLTGLWQVQARHDPDFERYKQLDLLYVRAFSFRRDLGILFRTPVVVVGDAWRGARTTAKVPEGLRKMRADRRGSGHHVRREATRNAYVVAAGVIGTAIIAAAAFAVLVFAALFAVSSVAGGGERAETLVKKPSTITADPPSPGSPTAPPTPDAVSEPLSRNTAPQTEDSTPPPSNRLTTPQTTAGSQAPEPTSLSSNSGQPLSLASSLPPIGAPAADPTAAPVGSPTCPGDAKKSPNGQVGRCSGT